MVSHSCLDNYVFRFIIVVGKLTKNNNVILTQIIFRFVNALKDKIVSHAILPR